MVTQERVDYDKGWNDYNDGLPFSLIRSDDWQRGWTEAQDAKEIIRTPPWSN